MINGDGDGICQPNWPTESDLVAAYQGALLFAGCEADSNALYSQVLPADAAGSVRVIYQSYSGTFVQLRSILIGANIGVQTFTPALDTYITACCGLDNTREDSSQTLTLAAPFQSYEADELVKFNLQTLKPGAVVTWSTLNFTSDGNGFGVENVDAYQPNQSWSGSVTFDQGKPGVLRSSVSTTFKVNFANYPSGKTLSLNVTNPIMHVVQGSWSWVDNGLFIGEAPNATFDPGISLWSSKSTHSEVLSVRYICCVGNSEVVEPNESPNTTFSAVADSKYGIHLVYTGMPDGNTTYQYRASGSPSWATPVRHIFSPDPQDVCGSPPAQCYDTDPTITVDSSTNDLYAFSIYSPPAGSGLTPSIVMKRKTFSQDWHDASTTTVANKEGSGNINLISPRNLQSNYALFSGTNPSWITLTWTDWPILFFEQVPVQTVWSPFAAPPDPWDGYGVAPYGEYFQNLGESVSTSTGLLTIRQTDLSLPGRGLNLEIARVYTEPYSFLSGSPYPFEKYPWAPMGDGWQLNFPWMTKANVSFYIHLWNGEGYRIPYGFWSGTTAFFENHQGENFRMVRNSNDILLITKDGVSYRFAPSSHALTTITDPSGNTITFAYSNGLISTIIDTIGRTLLFCYSGLLARIDQATGPCSNELGKIRGVTFIYNGQDLASETDPAGRITSYNYTAASVSPAIAPWILSSIIYPTNWHTSFAYANSSIGTDALTFRVASQTVGTSQGATVRQFKFSYVPAPGGFVIGSTVQSYDGTQLAAYTDYSFSFAGMNQNVSDSNHNFVRGVEDLYGVAGLPVKEIILVTDGHGAIQSFTNFYGYDLWGNLIYSSKAIDNRALSYHDSFSSYYNDGVPVGFNSFQDSFSQANQTLPDNNWSISKGNWAVQASFLSLVTNGAYNGTGTSGNQGAMFASADLGHPILSSSYISTSTNIMLVNMENFSNPRTGIFVHYPGNGINKFSLVIRNDTYLELTNETSWLGDTQQNARCLIPSGVTYWAWYTLNLSVQYLGLLNSYYAQGTLSYSGSILCSVTGVFQTTGPDATGTGFGLYAGGYSVMFDNFTAGPGPTEFSSSFIPGGSPGPNIHGKVSGTGELQSSIGASGFVENYYGYTYQGGLSQTKKRFDSSTGRQWITTSRTYDNYGNQITLTDPRGNITRYGYSAKYRSAYLTSRNQTLVPGGTLIFSTFGHNINTGDMLSSVDPLGHNTTYAYDILSRVTKKTMPSNEGYTSYSYNDQLTYFNVTNENGWLAQRVYDGIGRLSKIIRFLNGQPYSTEVYTYNWQDKILSDTDPVGNTISYQYDALGRLTLVKKPDLNTTTVTYDDLDSWARSADENGVSKCIWTDRLGRTIDVVENALLFCTPATILTAYFYDEVGNLLRVTSSTGQSTSYTYDNLNRLTKTIYPDTTAETYLYDVGGNMVTKTDRNGIRTYHTYDSLDRLANITYRGSTITTDLYVYDDNSNLFQLLSQNATTTFSYDNRNRVTCESYAVNGILPSAVSGPCASGGGGSVAAGTLITMADHSLVPVQNLKVGDHLQSYNVTTNQFTVSSIIQTAKVDVHDMLIISTRDGRDLRTDNATIQKLWVEQSTGKIGWLSVTQLRVGDRLFIPQSQTWTIVTSIKDIPGQFVMYDVYDTAPGDYIANGYLDPKKSPILGPTPSGTSSNGYSFQYWYTGETISSITYNDFTYASYSYDPLGRVQTMTHSFVAGTTSFSYYPNDQLKRVQYANGLVTNCTYTNLDQISTVKLKNGGAVPLYLAYQYNNTGTVASVTGWLTNTSNVQVNVSEK